MELTLPQGRFCGRTLATFGHDGVRLTETVYSPGLKLPRHSHERACFIFVIKGSFSETYGTRSRDCGPLNLIYRPVGEVHSDHFRDLGGRCLNIEIESTWLQQARQFSAGLDNSADFQAGPPNDLAMKIYKELQELDEVSPLSIGGLALELMAETARWSLKVAANAPPRWLEQAREILHARFSENIAISDIASTVGVHPAHLSRAFRRSYGYTIGEYLRKLRVEFACRKLSTSDLPIVEIACAAGFYDQGHFSRMFKRLTRMTPARFRAVSRSC
jgi:AraC family transcriptional regulator